MPESALPLGELPEPLSKLHVLWRNRCGARAVPARRDFQVEELSQWLARLALIEVLADPEGFRFKVYGSELAGWHGRDLTGRSFLPEEMPVYAECARTGDPACISDRIALGRHSVEIKTLILPLSDDGSKINLLFACSHPLS